MELIETSVGLPNNCSVCGKPIITETWFAVHIDAARSGSGGHEACMKKSQKAGPVAIQPELPLEVEPVIAETYPTTASRKAKKANEV